MSHEVLTWLAVVLMALALCKIAVVLARWPMWLGWMRRLYAYPDRLAVVAGALALVVFALLLHAGVTVVQILAVTLFVALLFIAGAAPFAGQMLPIVEQMSLRAVLRRAWIASALWVALLIWGFVELLAG